MTSRELFLMFIFTDTFEMTKLGIKFVTIIKRFTPWKVNTAIDTLISICFKNLRLLHWNFGSTKPWSQPPECIMRMIVCSILFYSARHAQLCNLSWAFCMVEVWTVTRFVFVRPVFERVISVGFAVRIAQARMATCLFYIRMC